MQVAVPALEADRWYHYRFMLDDAVGPVGRTRTFYQAYYENMPLRASVLTQALGGLASLYLLDGDVHENWVGHVKADYAKPASASAGVDFCGISIRSHSGKTDSTAQLLSENPHFLFADSQSRGYGVAEFTARELEVRLRVLDDVTRPDSRIDTLTRFAVQAGRSVVERA